MITDARGRSGALRTVDAVASFVDKESHSRPGPEKTPADEIDIEAGWPPRVPRAIKLRAIMPSSSPRHSTVHDRLRATKTALAHREVSERLSGRWELLGCHQECRRGGALELRVAVFNYTSNELIEACVVDDRVTSVAIRDAHEHPESPVEMAQAIGLARSDPAIADLVREMDAHAILQVPEDTESAGHRCMLVMFTDRADPHRELPVRYSALVDLALQKVIVSGPSPCEMAARSSDKRRPGSRAADQGE